MPEKINFSVGVPEMTNKISCQSYRHEALIKKVQARRFAPELEAEVIKRIRSFPEAGLGKFNLYKTIEESIEKVRNDATRNKDGNNTTTADT